MSQAVVDPVARIHDRIAKSINGRKRTDELAQSDMARSGAPQVCRRIFTTFETPGPIH